MGGFFCLFLVELISFILKLKLQDTPYLQQQQVGLTNFKMLNSTE
jgi:hypothetical protein